MSARAVPRHTPYDGSVKPFTIGLRPLDPAEWIEVDDRLGRGVLGSAEGEGLGDHQRHHEQQHHPDLKGNGHSHPGS